MEKINEADLDLFANAALKRLAEIYERAPVAGLYRERLLMLALAQGGALHFLDQKNGLKDIDIWAFYRGGLEKPFPFRTVWTKDFGQSKFGRNPHDGGFSGRRMDIIGRAVECRPEDDLITPTMRWLHGHSRSAWALRQKAVVCIYPPSVRGRVLIKPQY
ncbi:hypothetical protein ACSV5N_07570 [Agrobacterium salinitolerans]|uniref:hypothetical protein n=1 Tax=Agrobacterium salinitolerans TaxID=1183413 RepID=UPI003FD661AE